jgi:2-methylcitrate dehydratase PrpD
MQSIGEKAPVLYKLTEFIHGLHEYPDNSYHQVKRVIADTTGCAFSGVKTEAFSSAIESNKKIYGQGNYPIWGTKKTSSLSGAVFFNTLSISCTDYDEGHRKAVGHPASLVVPVSIILGGHLCCTSKEILNAVIIGYEIGTRFSYARKPESIETYSSGRWGAIGTAASCAYLMKLSQEKTMHALSLASVLSPAMLGGSIDVSTGSMAKEGVPWAAQVGMQSALLAETGFVGPYLFAEDPNAYDTRKLLKGSNDALMIEGNYFKPYACCRWLHTAIQETLEIKDAEAVLPENILILRAEVFGRAIKLIDSRYPENTVQAQFHLPYVIAVALQHGKVIPEFFGDFSLADEQIRRLIDKVHLVENPAYSNEFPGKLLSSVEIVMSGGKVLRRKINDAPWDSANPPADEALQRKFIDQTGEGGEQIWDAIFTGNFQAF